MKLSQRLDALPPYLFYSISKKIAEKKAQGERVISFGIGDPDIPTPSAIVDSVCKAVHDPSTHRYPESDSLPEMRKAVADWYQERFSIALDPDTEVLPLIGAKEGIAHIAFCLLDAGDIALVPDPGYPVYSIGTLLAGGTSYFLPLEAKNNFLPDLQTIPSDVLEKAKVLWINYPNNPTGVVAGIDFFDEVVRFAKKYNIAVCHDAPYTEVAFDGYKPVSFLEAEGAREVGIEFHSLSKSYNMTGWRIGMAVGNKTLIDALKRFKSNVDSGIPNFIQMAAIDALRGSQDCIEEHNRIYQNRRDKIVTTLKKVGIQAETPSASLYVWAKTPEGYSSLDFAAALLDEAAVVVTPGTGYGSNGEGYVRLSMTISDEELEIGLDRIEKWLLGKPGK